MSRLNPNSVDVTKNFTISGVKEIGNYTYVLKIDLGGQAIIQRIILDNSEIKFYRIPKGEIDTRWADPSAQSYTWIHQV